MNDSETIPQNPVAARSRTDEFMLPQWVLELLRPLVWVISRLFWKIEHIGVEHIPNEGAVVIAANHQSYLDPFWLSLPVKRPVRYLAWSVALNWPIVGKALRFLGAWPLHVEGSDPAAIRRTLQWLRDGGAIVIFPEGGRGKPDGSMVRFKGGATRIALDAEVPILPVTIRGGNRIWPSGRRLPGLGRVQVIYHPLFEVNQRADEETRACARRETEALAEIIGSALR